MYDPAKITVPTLIAIGEWDKDTPPYMAQAIFPLLVNSPGKRLVMLAEGTHHMMLEKNREALFAPCRRSSTRVASRLTSMISHDAPRASSACCSRQALRRRAGAARRRNFPPVQPVTAQHGMVVAQESRAALIGAEVLKRGGNAVDAAVAVGFAMAVTYPRAGNIGGGGFMLIHLADGKQQDIAIDYRETAPAATTRDTFLDAKGEADPAKSREQGLAIGVPGTVAGLTLALQKYGSGKFKLAQLIAPAIDLARHGYKVGDEFEDTGRSSIARMARWPSTAKLFLQARRLADRARHAAGAVRSRRARSRRSPSSGPRAFYEGPVADKISAAVREAGGLMTSDDLKNYKAVERPVLRGSYRGFDIVSMPPPSSGGVVLLEMLNVLEGFKLKADDPDFDASDGRDHALRLCRPRAAARRSGFRQGADRGPDVEALCRDVARAASTASARRRRTRSRPPTRPAFEGNNTTHYSVVDRFGNAVANTYTINLSYGVGLIAEGTGVLLNNELDDFAAAPGVPNAFGLVGYEANEPGPNKRPLSSMTPTIVLQQRQAVDRHRLAGRQPHHHRGAAGAAQRHRLPHDASREAVQAPRIHHQWLPDETMVEAGVSGCDGEGAGGARPQRAGSGRRSPRRLRSW